MTRQLTSYPLTSKGANLIEKHKNYLIEYGDKSGVNLIDRIESSVKSGPERKPSKTAGETAVVLPSNSDRDAWDYGSTENDYNQHPAVTI